MIFLHDRNGIIKTADTLKRNKRRTEKTELLKAGQGIGGKQKIKFCASDKIENSAEELSENQKE